MTEAKTINWPTIEKDYRAGIKSLRSIAAEHFVTEGAIRKRAKRDSWERDLSQRIKAKADDLVRRATVRDLVRAETAVTERVLVEVNAQVQKEVMMAHRSDIGKSRKLAMTLMRELELQTDNLPLLEQFADIMLAPNEKGQDRQNELYRKLISLSSRASTLKTMADALKTLIMLERQAFGLDNLQEQDNTGVESVIARVMEKHGGAEFVASAQMQLPYEESETPEPQYDGDGDGGAGSGNADDARYTDRRGEAPDTDWDADFATDLPSRDEAD